VLYWLIKKIAIAYVLLFALVWLIDAALVWQVIAVLFAIWYAAGWIWPSVSDEDRAAACRGPSPEEMRAFLYRDIEDGRL